MTTPSASDTSSNVSDHRLDSPLDETAQLNPSYFHKSGVLSIVVQGSLYENNIVDVALHCEHWRFLFPVAEIILAIAVTDILVGSQGKRMLLENPRLVLAHRHDGLLQSALTRLKTACNAIYLSEGALPLPPIKTDSKINNVNLQIVAAKTGLAVATGEYSLRIRSDIVFLSTDFLDFYCRHRTLPRRAPAVFRDRVMISPLFTLNPFTMERMPFHFSDWFHFGRTEDVRSIWNIDEMSLQDAVYYNTHSHSEWSNHLERKFRVKLAVEQYINYTFLQKKIPNISLACLNDPKASQNSMEILLSEFIIGDLRSMHVMFDKYKKAFSDPNIELLCITHPQWRRLNELPPNTDFHQFYKDDARRASRIILIREDPLMKPIKFWIGVRKYLSRKFGGVRRLVGLALAEMHKRS